MRIMSPPETELAGNLGDREYVGEAFEIREIGDVTGVAWDDVAMNAARCRTIGPDTAPTRRVRCRAPRPVRSIAFVGTARATRVIRSA